MSFFLHFTFVVGNVSVERDINIHFLCALFFNALKSSNIISGDSSYLHVGAVNVISVL